MFRKSNKRPKMAISGNSCVRDVVEVTPNRFKSSVLDAPRYQLNHPVAEIVTDLETLRNAGINPQIVPTSNLMTPTDPAVLGAIAERQLTDIACNVINENNIENNINNKNTSTNE